ncbi:MAG: hypothetical protein P1V20_05310 [Verrucomicrobiales bacterium]|nr:hypothetical protein [Verrucomicrobiales bacterium]
MIQAAGYATQLGSQFIAITNGKQWIISLTFVQAQAIEDRQVFVFDSLESIERNFRLFWDCFSKNGIESNSIAESLIDSRAKPAPRKLSGEIPNYPQISDRNVYLNELSFVLNKLWDVLDTCEHSEEFLNHCYVESSYNKDITTYAREILKMRSEADENLRSTDVDHVVKVSDSIKSGLSDKPFVILGEVGRGKTSFLDHLRLFSGKHELDKYIQIQLNFLDRPDNEGEVTEFIYEEIETLLLNEFKIDIQEDSIVRGVLHTELGRFRKSSKWKLQSGDPDLERKAESDFIEEKIRSKHKYFRDLFRHLKKGQGKSIAIFFDNLDRRNGQIQEAAFLKASSIARDWGCAVFICLRPETFFESLANGVLDSVAPKTFTVGQPDLSLVLKRRFDYAKRITMGDIENPIVKQFVNDTHVALKLPSVAEILECCRFSSRKKTSAIQMLTALSNSNIRELNDLAKRILTSGHLDTRKIISRIQESGNYTIPDFEAVKTLLYGDYKQFDPHSSVFLNLFEVFYSDRKEHFFRILALEFLSRFDKATEDDGYVSAVNFKQYMQSYHFSSDVFIRHLDKLIKGKCIKVQNLQGRSGILNEGYRIRSRGVFHLYEMTSQFQYYDAMIVDTPIIDNAVKTQLFVGDDLKERLISTRVFIEYLKDSLTQLHDSSGRTLISELLDKGEKEIDEIESSQKAPRKGRHKK